MKTLMLLVSAVLLAAACGKQDTPQTQGNPPCPNGTACKQNVEDPSGFYSAFVYRLPTDCQNTAFRFTWLTLADRVVVAKSTEGDDIIADIQVWMTDDHNFTARYQEKTQKRGDGGVFVTTAINNAKDFGGQWGVQGAALVVNGIGQGLAVRARGFLGVQFTLQDDQQMNPLLKGHLLSFIPVLSATSKDGKSVADACVKPEAKQ